MLIIVESERRSSCSRKKGFTLLSHNVGSVDEYKTESLDCLLFTMAINLMPLGDGPRRLADLRDALDGMIELRGRQLLGLKT